ncbi:Ribosomal L32p protein family [Trifolium repens]|nr:Ribosomal L32p protein family [Trifolium repens]
MTMRIAIVRDARKKLDRFLGFNRLIHSIPQSPPLARSINHGIHSVQPVLPEFSSPIFSFGGCSMELMAVPKRKTSPHKRGIRNGPKALKPVPVLVLCKGCGRVRLPHFYCCSGKPNQENNCGHNGTS